MTLGEEPLGDGPSGAAPATGPRDNSGDERPAMTLGEEPLGSTRRSNLPRIHPGARGYGRAPEQPPESVG